MKKIQKEHDTIIYLKIFIFVVGVLVFLSLSFKLLKLVTNRKFNTYSFNILQVSKNNSKLIHIDSNENVLAEITLNKIDKHKPDEIITTAELAFQVPIDGLIVSSNSSVPQLLSLKSALSALMGTFSSKYYNLNSLDILKSYLVTRSLKSENKTSINLVGKNITDTRKFLREIINEETLLNEKTSIEIINSTDVVGLGTKVASMLESAGFDIVVINNGRNQKKTKIIKRIADNETVKRLERLFSAKGEKREAGAVADVTVVVGEDFASNYR